ncbi:hypothetical protein MYO4S_00084 [Serratia phage 4S]|nr:hypothetical protein MYO4S_00084 [Serratia phage 4S]
MAVNILGKHAKDTIVELYHGGASKAHLARLYKVSSDTITRVLKEQHDAAQVAKAQVEDIEPTVLRFVGTTFIEGDLVAKKIVVDSKDTSLGVVYVLGDVMDTNDGGYSDLTEDDCDDEDVFSDIPVYCRELKVVNPNYAYDEITYANDEDEFEEISGSEYYRAEEENKTKVVAFAPVETPVVPKEKFIWNANSKFISITVGRDTFNADRDHPNFQLALQALVEDKVEEALEYINIERKIVKFVKGNVRIEDGALYYKDLFIDSGLTKRILDAANAGEDFSKLLTFLEALMLNPSRTAVYRLYDFLNANDIEITDRGTFLAWKKVRADYRDIHSGTFDNSPGKTCEMPRNMVDEDDERTCSAGLHVCSKSYLNHFGSSHNNRVVQVEVHPADVVSIPVDYGNAKMRCAKYTVLKDVTGELSY